MTFGLINKSEQDNETYEQFDEFIIGEHKGNVTTNLFPHDKNVLAEW